MGRSKNFAVGILLILIGCSQHNVKTLDIAKTPAPSGPGTGNSIVILPFADYSRGDIASIQRKNILITESLTDLFISQGFNLPIQEDVLAYLVENDAFEFSSSDTANTKSLAVELTNDWSKSMKSSIKRYKNQVERLATPRVDTSSLIHGLTKKQIAQLGRHFDVDYVVRGRIVEFKTGQEATWQSWNKEEILPVINGPTTRFRHGFAKTEASDKKNESITEILLVDNSEPWSWPHSKRILGVSSEQLTGAILWNYGEGEVPYAIDQATIRIRLWVQEAATGRIVWTNRVRIAISPETIFADKQYETMLNKAIEKGVDTLVKHFVAYGL